MLVELRVENLLLIARAELSLAPGLNVLTGETGAGKTVLAHALDLLMGGRARAGIVRPGCEEAYVEGIFSVPLQMRAEVAELLPESARQAVGGAGDDGSESVVRAGDTDPEGAGGAGEELVLARRVGSDGRTRAYVNGRAAAVSDLRELGSRLISFYGQHEHRKLVLASAQLQMLDAVCDSKHAERLRECAASHRELGRLQADLERLGELGRARERELDLLEHELDEIDAAQPDEQEHSRLLARRELLRSVEALRAAAGAAAEALSPESPDAPGAADLAARAAGALESVAGVDEQLDALARRCGALAIEAQDLAGELRIYGESVEGEEGELQTVEERLSASERVLRKHGGTIASVLDYGERARARAQELRGAEVAQAETEAALAREREMLATHVATLRRSREAAARRLAETVREQLAALAMPDAAFEIALAPVEPRPSGGDAAEFTIAANPGVAPAPLREIASGGELSRVMLALASACEQVAADGEGKRGSAGDAVGGGSTLVFDEIDAGIGGHTARAVGERLQALASCRQVVCITHLPQIASLAQRHFTVSKDTAADLALATVEQLAEKEVEGELVRMLGAAADDIGARRHARQLRKAA